MARQTKSWAVEVSYKPVAWSESATPHTIEYHVIADDEDTAKTIACAAYCEQHLTDVESEKFIDAIELSQTPWVQS